MIGGMGGHPDKDGLWPAMAARLGAEDAPTYAARFAALIETGIEGGRVTLRAPSRFHASYVTTHLADRLLLAARRADPTVSAVRVIAG